MDNLGFLGSQVMVRKGAVELGIGDFLAVPVSRVCSGKGQSRFVSLATARHVLANWGKSRQSRLVSPGSGEVRQSRQVRPRHGTGSLALGSPGTLARGWSKWGKSWQLR